MGLFVETVLAIAKAELGYAEKTSATSLDSKTGNAGKNNYTKYWRDLQPSFQGQPWCNAFVIWCMVQAYGVSDAKKLMCTDGGWSYYTPTSASYFKSKGQWYTTPKVGDVIFFKNSVRIHHVGLVYKVDSTRVYTYEGNTSSGSAVVANGGEVAAKSYLLNNSAIAGYGRPRYDEEVKYSIGWNKDASGWWYADTETSYLKDTWKGINRHRYYFGSDGYILRGWQLIEGKWYYFQPDGELEGALYRSDEEGAQSIWEV